MLPTNGPLLESDQAALDLIGEAWGVEFDVVVIPKERLAPEFLDLKSTLLGQVTQKFVNYNVRAGFVGDFSAEMAASRAFNDYVYETNQGGRLLFARDLDELTGLVAGH